MFDNLNDPSTNSNANKTEDIFAGVENSNEEIKLKPPVFQPKEESAEAVATATNPKPAADNKRYFILGTLILLVALVLIGGWYGFKNFSIFKSQKTAEDNVPAQQAATNEPAVNNANNENNNQAVIPTPATNEATSSENAIATTGSEDSSASVVDTQASSSAKISTTDSDNDGLTDYEELTVYKTNPLKVDSDDDELSDFQEVKVYRTDPLKSDTDNDGFLDGQEVKNGFDPLRPGKKLEATSSIK